MKNIVARGHSNTHCSRWAAKNIVLPLYRSGALNKGQTVIADALCDYCHVGQRQKKCVVCSIHECGAHKQFSNSTLMLWLSKHGSKFGVPREWVFIELEHGKNDCESLGAHIKKVL